MYARITDNVGNVTYLSSDGILHDDEKPYIFDITPVMKDRSGSVTFDIFEDGSGLEKVYFLYSTDINEVTSATTENLKASDYHNATGTFTLSDLKPNTEYYCAVLAVDKAGNESYLLNSTFKTLKEAITGTVSISGEAVYGKTLTASYEGLATDAGEVTVSWYRGEDTTAIATGDTYTLTADDVGKVITVKVTAANCSGELTDSTAEVAKAEHPNPPTNGKVDDENNTFTFNGTSGVTYEYSTDGGANWTDVTVDSGTGVGTVTVGNVIVNTGDLQVRAKETDVYKASDVISNTSAYTATLEGSVSLSGAAKYGETLTATVTGAQQGAVLTYTFCADDTVLQQGSSNTYKIEQEAIGKQITVKVSAEGYIGTVNDTSDTVAKAEGVLTLRQTEFTQTFGDEAFELGCSRTGDGTISYKVSDSKKADGTAAGDDNSVIKVSDTGVVTIVGAGSATVTVSLSETKCYTGAAEQTIMVTVNQASAPTLASENISYVNTKGSGGAVTIDIADKLPENRGDTTYTVTDTTDSSVILQNVAVDTAGKLTYTVISGKKVGDKANITVTAQMANYKSATFTVNISITDKIVVALKNGSSVTINGSNALTYGDKLSKLNLGKAVFVEKGTNTVVPGTLEFAAPDDVPTVGTTTAGWKFTPDDADIYVGLTGTVEISVSRATPNVTIPTVSKTNIVYDPAKTLKDYTLNGTDGTWVVGGTETSVAGTWSWKTDTTVPTVNNSGYVAVFTPDDTNNYNTVTGTITVKVTKATPVIAKNPTATALTYGQKLSDSTLTGGKVTYKTADGTEVAGTFAWKNSSIKPTVADSGKIEYDVTFTPSDTDNYNAVDMKISLTVNKATKAPNMPETAMAPAHSTKKVGDITLPDGWSWQEADKDTVLADGVAVTATAVYTGADKGNYETESVSITITRSKCDHTHTEIRNQREATCKEEGYTGDTYCKDCGEKLAAGTTTGKKPHTVGTPATCVSKAVCSVCGETFGEVDATNHVHTTVKNRREATCIQTGYTGDTYCTDCDKLMSTGKELAALGHDYKATVTKQPTTTEEGVRTYTCTRCGHSYTESIAKLTSPSPQPTATPSDKPETPSPQPKGTNLKDDTGAAYKVTSANGKTPAVQYIAPKSGVKGTVTVPSEVTIDGVTYKVTSIAGNAFKGTKKIKKIVIGSNITSIGKNAFAGCTSLTSITIGKNVTKIGKNAFTGCKKLKSITIKTKKLTTKTVKKGAFNGISKKVVVKVPKSKYKTYKKLLPAKGLKKAAKIRK